MNTLEKWQELAKTIRIRAYDPRAKVSLNVGLGYYRGTSAIIRYSIVGAPDTTDPGGYRTMQDNFHLKMSVAGWPGKERAAEVILGGWMLLTAHEAMELVTLREPQNTHNFRGDGYYHPTPCYTSEYRVNDPHRDHSRIHDDVNKIECCNAAPYVLRQIYDWSLVQANRFYSEACLTHLDELEESYG